MAAEADRDCELSALVVPAVGTVVMREDPWEPVRLIDGAGEPVAAVTAFLRELQTSGRSVATLRSYGMDLLAGFGSGGPSTWPGSRRHAWRHASSAAGWRCGTSRPAAAVARRWPGGGESGDGQARPGPRYAAATRAHSETVLWIFYNYHRDAGTGPMVNPFPLARERRGGRANPTGLAIERLLLQAVVAGNRPDAGPSGRARKGADVGR